MTERRPRIPDELSARIDRLRGLVPFEAWVRSALELHATQVEERRGLITADEARDRENRAHIPPWSDQD